MARFFVEFAKNALLFFTTLAVLFGLLEVGARLFSDVRPSLRQKDPVIGYRYARSTEQDVFDPESGRTVHMRFNKDGFRGPDYALQPAAGVTRVAVIGDSMVAALQVPEEQTMVRRVEAALNERYGAGTWEVMNFGVSGSSPGQEIAVWRNEVRRFHPDIVLVAYFNGNDFANNCKCIDPKIGRIYFDLDDDGVYRQQPHSETSTRLSLFLNMHSAFYIWQKEAFRTLRYRLKGEIVDGKYVRTWKDGDWVYASKGNKNTEYAWRLTEEALKTFNREVSDYGAQFGVIIFPHGPQIYHDLFAEMAALRPIDEWEPDPDNPEKHLLEICEANGITCWPLVDYFRRAAPSASNQVEDEALFYLKGDGHFNERGNAVAAAAVLEFIEQQFVN